MLLLAVWPWCLHAQEYASADDYQYAQEQDSLYHDYAARQETKAVAKP